MWSNLLDIIGLLLIVVAAGVAFGVAPAIAATGVCCLVVSWTMTRSK